MAALTASAYRPAVVLISLLVVAGGRSGCSNPSTPNSSPSPSVTPGFPRGVPNATALENLPLIESLERAQGRQTTRLVWVSTWANLDGRTRFDWLYQFGEIVDNRASLFEWAVRTDGTIRHHDRIPDFNRVEYTEVRPLPIDSPEMVRFGLQYGGQRFLDRYPSANAFVVIIYRFLGGEPICYMAFDALPSVGCAPIIYVHAHTGALMARDLSCLDR